MQFKRIVLLCVLVILVASSAMGLVGCGSGASASGPTGDWWIAKDLVKMTVLIQTTLKSGGTATTKIYTDTSASKMAGAEQVGTWSQKGDVITVTFAGTGAQDLTLGKDGAGAETLSIGSTPLYYRDKAVAIKNVNK